MGFPLICKNLENSCNFVNLENWNFTLDLEFLELVYAEMLEEGI